jgi:hypothetical protein
MKRICSLIIIGSFSRWEDCIYIIDWKRHQDAVQKQQSTKQNSDAHHLTACSTASSPWMPSKCRMLGSQSRGIYTKKKHLPSEKCTGYIQPLRPYLKNNENDRWPTWSPLCIWTSRPCRAARSSAFRFPVDQKLLLSWSATLAERTPIKAFRYDLVMITSGMLPPRSSGSSSRMSAPCIPSSLPSLWSLVHSASLSVANT